MVGEQDPGRKIIRVAGADREDFLQGLVTNDVRRLKDGLVYAALLSPQGKYLSDFFLVPSDDSVLIDVAEPMAESLLKRLSMYRLRAAVTLELTDLSVQRGLGDVPEGGYADPRHTGLGWRLYGAAPGARATTDWEALRVELGIPESGVELHANDTYVLEAGFERLNGVDFKKGCYVGQEVTARMKHKTELRKGVVQVDVEGIADVGTDITANGKSVGRLYSQANGKGLAYLRFDRARGDLKAGDAIVTWTGT